MPIRGGTMKIIDVFRKLGIFVDNPYSRRFHQNILGTKVFICVYVDGIAYNVKADDVKFATSEDGRLTAITLVANERPKTTDVESEMVLMGGY